MPQLPDCCFPPTDSAIPCESYAEAMAEIARLTADREAYNAWAAEIKIGIDELKAENEQLRAALPELLDGFEDALDFAEEQMRDTRTGRARLAALRAEFGIPSKNGDEQSTRE